MRNRALCPVFNVSMTNWALCLVFNVCKCKVSCKCTYFISNTWTLYMIIYQKGEALVNFNLVLCYCQSFKTIMQIFSRKSQGDLWIKFTLWMHLYCPPGMERSHRDKGYMSNTILQDCQSWHMCPFWRHT